MKLQKYKEVITKELDDCYYFTELKKSLNYWTSRIDEEINKRV